MTRNEAMTMILASRRDLDEELGTAPDQWTERPEAKLVRLASELGDVARQVSGKDSHEYVRQLAQLGAVVIAALESSQIDVAYFLRDVHLQVQRSTAER